jgi:hypothetical protein
VRGASDGEVLPCGEVFLMRKYFSMMVEKFFLNGKSLSLAGKDGIDEDKMSSLTTG